MGFFIFDFLKCEPFEIGFRIYILTGFWPLNTVVKWKQFLFSIYSFLAFFSFTSIIAVQFLELFLVRNDMATFTKDLISISLSTGIVIQSTILIGKVDLVNGLRNRCNYYKKWVSDLEDMKILEKSDKRIISNLKIFFVSIFSTNFIWMVYPAIYQDQGTGVPFPYRLPVDEWTSAIRTWVYIYQVLAMFWFGFNLLATTAMFSGFVLKIIAHYDIIIKNIRSLENGYGNTWVSFSMGRVMKKQLEDVQTRYLMESLNENTKLHENLLGELKMLREICKPTSLLHYLTGIVVVTTAIFDMNRMTQGSLIILHRMLYLATGLGDTFLYCFFASLLHEKSIELSLSVYECPWYKWKPKVRKHLQLIMLKAQKAPKLMIGNFFALELRTFLNLLRITYDITAILYHSVK